MMLQRYYHGLVKVGGLMIKEMQKKRKLHVLEEHDNIEDESEDEKVATHCGSAKEHGNSFIGQGSSSTCSQFLVFLICLKQYACRYHLHY
ncbi:dynein light chain 1, cytoplasmic [Iris pallida]|uniref:Dynein light chain 1, cytoplasmic n=1 Tax=Iris pallida TaxID=29817 RepID=A0AAX6DQD4_IRIPA|nr:dynein light chain 1, cytoplasmic [Iris pallida]KAJ6819079.1 dynein light chain 1, cytoplasmic [Iris pallida]